MKENYKIIELVRNKISDFLGERPIKILNLKELLNKKEYEGYINVIFSEEIKDGRSSKFNIDTFTKLKHLGIYDYDFAVVRFMNINFEKAEEQESESESQYFHYYYLVKVNIQYI